VKCHGSVDFQGRCVCRDSPCVKLLRWNWGQVDAPSPANWGDQLVPDAPLACCAQGWPKNLGN
jgi:hypothetical protein